MPAFARRAFAVARPMADRSARPFSVEAKDGLPATAVFRGPQDGLLRQGDGGQPSPRCGDGWRTLLDSNRFALVR
jgi:hypothetical protein